jgi:hypothetical protein
MLYNQLNRYIPLSLCLLAALTPAAWAQSTFATITGNVTDPSGAPVPGAAVEVVQRQTNYRYTAQTDTNGLYVIVNLQDGTYRLSVKAAGFQEYRVDDIIVAGREIRRVDVPMRIGTVDTVVEVTGGAALIETETARIASTQDREVLRALPLTLRRAWDYFTMTPNVERTSGWHIRFSGTGNLQGDATIDGTTVAGAFASPIGPLLDRTELVQEMRIDQAQNSAEHATMGQVAMVSRAGSNEWHGVAADYYSTPAFRARNPFTNGRDSTRRHQMIFSAGGPVWIPKIYDGRNKTFFFWTLEIAQGSKNVQQLTRGVPLQNWRNGDFSDQTAPVRDPFNSGNPFPNNRIPDSRLNAVSRRYQQDYIPLPNFGSTSVFSPTNFRDTWLLPFVAQPTQTFRADHRFGDKHQIYGRYTNVRWNFDGPETSLPTLGIGTKAPNFRKMDTLTTAHTWTMTPTLLNEIRYGISSQRWPQGTTINGLDMVNNYGLRGLAPGLPSVGGIHRIFFDQLGISAVTSRATCDPCDTQWAHSIYQTLTWIKSKHTMKMGVNLRRSSFEQLRQPDALFGQTRYSTRFTGHTYADFILGIPTTMTRAFPAVQQNQFRWTQGYFFTDEWRINPKLTLTVGLRWDAQMPWGEANNLLAVFDVPTGKIVVPNGMLGQVNRLFPRNYVDVVEASQANRPDRLIQTDWNNWQPRFGFAYRPFANTVVRGGFGIAYNQAPRGVATAGLPYVLNEPDFTNPTDNPLVLPVVFPSTGTAGPSTVSIPNSVKPDIKIGRVIQYSFTIEHQRWDMGFLANYTGTGTRQGVWGYDVNSPLANSELYVNKPRRFPNYPSINFFDNGAGHQYHALTLQAERRARGGLYFRTYYTWAKDIGDLEDGQTPEYAFDRRRERAWWERMPLHRWSMSSMWDLPVGKGRKWANGMNRWAEGILGGWQLSTIAAIESGRALTPFWSGPDPTGTRFTPNATRPVVTLRPDRIGNPNLGNPTIDRWFDLGAFGAPAVGSFGSAPKGAIIGPGTQVMHNSIAKHFMIKERVRLRLEFLATNTLNHPNWQDPNTTINAAGVAGKVTNVIDRNNRFDSAIPREIQAQIRLEW